MKIINETKYRTRDLRRIITRVAKDELTPEQKRKLTIIVTAGKQGRGSSGCCYGPRRILIRLNEEKPDRIDFAMVIAHEMYHAAGRRSGKSNEYWMRRSSRYGRPGTTFGIADRNKRYAWAENTVAFPLGHQPPPKKKPKQTGAALAMQKAEHYRKLAIKWETKLKRAKTALTNYRQKIRYHERRAAAMKQPTEQEQ